MTKQDQQRAERILEYIRDRVAERGYPPTVREIAEAVGLASTSAVHHHLLKLEREGKLQKDATRSRALTIPGSVGGRVVQAPIVGEIAAGEPIYAYEDKTEAMSIPGEMAARGRDTFVLRVRGKSMIEDHIDDGDYVVVQAQNTARDGDIVVALLEDRATLKRFFREKDRIRLQPANGQMQPIYTRDIQIQGKVIGLIRRLA
jgi:repressor LexA